MYLHRNVHNIITVIEWLILITGRNQNVKLIMIDNKYYIMIHPNVIVYERKTKMYLSLKFVQIKTYSFLNFNIDYLIMYNISHKYYISFSYLIIDYYNICKYIFSIRS